MKKVTSIILYDKKKRVLLQKRTNDAKRFPGFWGSFGGGIENNETALECVKRECLEELSYKLKNPRFVFKSNFGKLENNVFIEEYDPKKELILKEGERMGWFKFDEVEKLKAPYHVKMVIRKVKEFIL